jgi:hypothetical protein
MMAGIVLQRVSSTTTLYEPQSPAPGEAMWFLLWSQTDPPSQLTLEQTWSESGPPAAPGYFLFLNELPPSGSADKFEKKVRDLLPATTLAGFSWVVYTPKTEDVKVGTRVGLELDSGNRPVVDADTSITLPPGMTTLGVGKGAPVTASTTGGFVDAFVVGYPPQWGAQSYRGGGLNLPMTGNFVGCLQFRGLVNAAEGTGGPSALKSLATVQIDPLRPFDPKRTFQTFTGVDYLLVAEGNGYRLERAP